MRTIFVIFLLTALVSPRVASAEIQTFTATHTYILGDRDSKDDARQQCLLEAKRKIIEQVGVYIESASEVKNFDLTKDTITSFAAAVMHVKDTKENVNFESGHMTMTLTLKANVDLAEVRKQLAARQLDSGLRDTVAVQQERLKRLEVQLGAMQRQQGGQSPGQALTSTPIDISAEDLQTLRTQATQGNADSQAFLGWLYAEGKGLPQDYVKARQWYEKAAAQGIAEAQFRLGMLYAKGKGVSQDYVKAQQWWEKAAAQGHGLSMGQYGLLYAEGRGVQQSDVKAYMWFDLAAKAKEAITDSVQKTATKGRDAIALILTPAQLVKAKWLSEQCQAQQFKDCLSSVPAEWVKVSEADDFTMYVDPDTILRQGNLVTMSQLTDLKTARTVGRVSYLSDKSQYESDCEEKQRRVIKYYWVSGNMGNGEVVFSKLDPGKWSPVKAESIGEKLWKLACEKQ